MCFLLLFVSLFIRFLSFRACACARMWASALHPGRLIDHALLLEVTLEMAHLQVGEGGKQKDKAN
jgi:hypothetical protein